MLTLGIETSCDETGVSVTEGRNVLSNIVSSSVHLHKKYGGVVPEIASRCHLEFITEVLDKALDQARKDLKDIRLIAVTNGPGLVGALLTGISLGKALSYGLNIPLIGVNHVLAHLYSAFLNERDVPEFPFVGLVVSGGHTALFYCGKGFKQRLLGQTQDDAAGEAFDKVAKILSLGYPGGPVIEKRALLSRHGGSVRLPKTFLGKDSLDFSFSGIKTAVLYHVRDREAKGQGSGVKPACLKSGDKQSGRGQEINDICYAFQENVLDELVEKAFLAASVHKVKTIVVGGGVAANSRFREKFGEASKFSGGIKIFFPERKYCMDNAAMVGVLGERLYRSGSRSSLYLSAEPNLEVINA